MEYQEFVDGINSGAIQKATFSVTGYAHYRNCRVQSEIMTNPSGAYVGKIISFCLTPDQSEIRGFVDNIDEKAKLFHIKGKGSYTLKQMWSRITINTIE